MKRALALVALSALIFLAYSPVRDAAFLNYDDNEYVTANPHVAGGPDLESIEWAFTETHSANWHPVTWISHMVDVALFGVAPEDAGKHHLANVTVHVLATLLLAWLGFRLSGHWWPSVLVAALFGLHPLHVESVAWISERKDTLSATLGFATLVAWVGYVRGGGRLRYLLVTLLYALGLMAKPILVTWPVVMLLLEAWPLRRDLPLRARIVEKLPWFGLAVATAIATIVAQSSGQAIKSATVIPFGDRIVNAIHANVAYLGKLFAPLDLSVIYPHWATVPGLEGPSGLQTALELAVLAAITGACVWLQRRNGWRMPLVMWALWLVLLLPVIGIVQVGDQSMADRYTYLPSIAVFVVFAGALAWPSRNDPRSTVPSVAIVVLLLISCTIGTWQRAKVWHDSETLFAAAVEAQPMSPTAHLNLGHALARRGEVDRASHHYAIAARLRPGDPSAYYNLANSLRDRGRLEEAIDEYRRALDANPEYPAAANNLGDVFARLGRFPEAIEWFERAIRLDPDLAAAQINLARAHLITGDIASAVAAAERAVALDPSNESYRATLDQAREQLP